MSNEDIHNWSYKKVVCEGAPVSSAKERGTVFDDYENLKIPSVCKTNKINSSMMQYLTDILSDVAQATSYVNDVYGFHGIGNKLTVAQVLDCIEKSITVEIVSDIDSEHVSEDDDIIV